MSMQRNSQQRRSCKKKGNNLKSSSLPINFHAGGLMDWLTEWGKRQATSGIRGKGKGTRADGRHHADGAKQSSRAASACSPAMNMQLWKFCARSRAPKLCRQFTNILCNYLFYSLFAHLMWAVVGYRKRGRARPLSPEGGAKNRNKKQEKKTTQQSSEKYLLATKVLQMMFKGGKRKTE